MGSKYRASLVILPQPSSSINKPYTFENVNNFLRKSSRKCVVPGFSPGRLPSEPCGWVAMDRTARTRMKFRHTTHHFTQYPYLTDLSSQRLLCFGQHFCCFFGVWPPAYSRSSGWIEVIQARPARLFVCSLTPMSAVLRTRIVARNI